MVMVDVLVNELKSVCATLGRKDHSLIRLNDPKYMVLGVFCSGKVLKMVYRCAIYSGIGYGV